MIQKEEDASKETKESATDGDQDIEVEQAAQESEETTEESEGDKNGEG